MCGLLVVVWMEGCKREVLCKGFHIAEDRGVGRFNLASISAEILVAR